MSKETLELMKTLDFDLLETRLALQCAPVLSGLKISNLLTVSINDINELFSMFSETEFYIKVVYCDDSQAYCLVFKYDELSNYMSDERVVTFLKGLNYTSFELSDILDTFSIRFSKCREANEEFPHEIGFLLGYPYEDVFSFIEKEGKDSKYIGYWKVYHNIDHALKMFSLYDYVCEQAIRMVYHKQSVLKLSRCILCG